MESSLYLGGGQEAVQSHFFPEETQKLCDGKHLVMAYHALLHNHLCYGVVLWGHTPNCKEVLKLKKSAVHIMTSSKHLDHC